MPQVGTWDLLFAEEQFLLIVFLTLAVNLELGPEQNPCLEVYAPLRLVSVARAGSSWPESSCF